MLALFGVAVGADPSWLNGSCAAYVAMRAAHMTCYYANWQLARSIAFGISLAALSAMLISGMFALR